MGVACCDSSLEGEIGRPVREISRPATAPAGPKIKIEYFEGMNGRADPFVLLLMHKGVEFEKINVPGTAWGSRKARGDTGEFGALPIVSYSGKSHQQTMAILRSFGVQHGYYTDDWKKAGIIDAVCDTYGDFISAIAGVMFTP